ncbi:uncharacterized protein LOC113205823 [Frankliniella occidentalis]|uniref:Gustatory receptor n=1 Tax=Frankliniella occidentalis TaxID=133901 RepID=A0A6J1S8J3_FRAOC|nr:uncharacterized protein LOC113205823 [Frankliniella occidentalis]XP_052128307.1 uncharacterized protein LOC113205823 [Frankliniella occidentalis]
MGSTATAWQRVAVLSEKGLGVLATWVGVLPASGWPTAPRPWAAWAAYGYGLAVTVLFELNTSYHEFQWKKGFSAGAVVFFVAARLIIVLSSITGRAALSDLQRCLLLYCRAHPPSVLGYRAIVALVMVAVVFLAVVFCLLDANNNAWNVEKVMQMAVGVQWCSAYSLTLMPKAVIGSLASDLRQECSRLAAEAESPGRSCSHSSLMCKWRSARLRQQHLHDMSAATTAVFQWRLLALLATTILYGNLQMSDYFAKWIICSAKTRPNVYRQISQVLDALCHSVCCIIMFVVYRWESNEGEKICYTLMGHQAALAKNSKNTQSGDLREVCLFINQIRCQKNSSNMMWLFDLDYSNMMRIVSASLSYLVVMLQFQVLF